MATQLGDAEISSIEGTTITGWFRSINDKNVYSARPDWGAALLYDAFSSLSGLSRRESDLLPLIRSVTFETPNQPSTRFTIEVTDASALTGLTTGAWESYYIG